MADGAPRGADTAQPRVFSRSGTLVTLAMAGLWLWAFFSRLDTPVLFDGGSASSVIFQQFLYAGLVVALMYLGTEFRSARIRWLEVGAAIAFMLFGTGAAVSAYVATQLQSTPARVLTASLKTPAPTSADRHPEPSHLEALVRLPEGRERWTILRPDADILAHPDVVVMADPRDWTSPRATDSGELAGPGPVRIAIALVTGLATVDLARVAIRRRGRTYWRSVRFWAGS